MRALVMTSVVLRRVRNRLRIIIINDGMIKLGDVHYQSHILSAISTKPSNFMGLFYRYLRFYKSSAPFKNLVVLLVCRTGNSLIVVPSVRRQNTGASYALWHQFPV